MINATSAYFSKDIGRKFENVICGLLRLNHKELFYYSESDAECDFVAFKNNKAKLLIQVCCELNVDNYRREEKGLLSVMEFFGLKNGIILTIDQHDTIKNKTIEVIPA